MKSKFLIIICAFLFLQDSFAQSPWSLPKGEFNFGLGYSRKTAGKRWYPTSIDTKGTASGEDDTWTADSLQEGPPLIDGKFHDFRYVFFEPRIGLGWGFEVSALICWLDGWERTTSHPGKIPGTSIRLAEPEWEINRGFTDSWLRVKYQFPVKIPMALEVNTRFPDLYDEKGDNYSRFTYEINGQDTVVEPSGEWRGLLKRDFGINYHIGGNLDKKYRSFIRGQVGYNFRQGAFADQLIVAVAGGYTFPITKNFSICPNVFVDYIGGMGNGGTPDLTDRFYFNGRKNFYFNNSKTLRTYYNLELKFYNKLSITGGIGYWVWGRGAAKYTEPFVMINYSFSLKDIKR